MNKLKESILNDAKKVMNSRNDPTNVTASATIIAPDATTRSSNTYIYGIGIVTVTEAALKVTQTLVYFCI